MPRTYISLSSTLPPGSCSPNDSDCLDDINDDRDIKSIWTWFSTWFLCGSCVVPMWFLPGAMVLFVSPQSLRLANSRHNRTACLLCCPMHVVLAIHILWTRAQDVGWTSTKSCQRTQSRSPVALSWTTRTSWRLVKMCTFVLGYFRPRLPTSTTVSRYPKLAVYGFEA